MGQMKCIRCGQVEEVELGGCSLCGGDLISRFDVRPPSPGILRYPIIFIAGLVILVLSVLIGWAGSIIMLVLSVFLAISGVILGRLYPNHRIGAGVSVSLPYVMVTSYFLFGLFSYIFDPEYNGHYWNTEFFLAPAFLYLAPVLACGLGIETGAKKTLEPLVLLVACLGLTGFALSTVPVSEPVTKTNTFSFDLVENEDIHLQADIKCEYTVAKNYWSFTNTDRGDCTDTIVRVIRKRDGLSLPTDAYWTIDGVEEHTTMWPINRPDDGSSLGTDRNFDDILRWRSWSPFLKIAVSKRVAFRWGEINVEFNEQQYTAMKELVETVKTLVRE